VALGLPLREGEIPPAQQVAVVLLETRIYVLCTFRGIANERSLGRGRFLRRSRLQRSLREMRLT